MSSRFCSLSWAYFIDSIFEAPPTWPNPHYIASVRTAQRMSLYYCMFSLSVENNLTTELFPRNGCCTVACSRNYYFTWDPHVIIHLEGSFAFLTLWCIAVGLKIMKTNLVFCGSTSAQHSSDAVYLSSRKQRTCIWRICSLEVQRIQEPSSHEGCCTSHTQFIMTLCSYHTLINDAYSAANLISPDW
jgi:hypothetical protein